MIETWRGNVNAWECDELGHMNVKFYLTKASEALAGLAAQSGLNAIHRADANATLLPTALHVRFLAEAQPGAPLMIEAGWTAISESGCSAVLIMRHGGTGKPAASFRIDLDHVSPREGRAFAWPSHFAARLQGRMVEIPDFARPRGLAETKSRDSASLPRADALGLAHVGQGRFTPDEVDVFGRMRTEVLLGRISDSVVNFKDAFPEEWAFHRGEADGRIGSALLECRILPHRWPRAGDGYLVRSGLKSFGPKVRNIVHWVLDPATGKPWWTMEGIAAPMDLDARKITDLSDTVRPGLEQACISGLEA
ncbi:thioesterase family protein [uncultured Maricaulis sp.]|uniref:thioesterase family protein n=1 Tax=uncultured Maricaulis sp. TaxID=174710 RepID=UPI0030D76EB5|tara:strand:- start:176 stop:1099 length:924 start_codon:yes stop_codon:yes gene_type:complete